MRNVIAPVLLLLTQVSAPVDVQRRGAARPGTPADDGGEARSPGARRVGIAATSLGRPPRLSRVDSSDVPGGTESGVARPPSAVAGGLAERALQLMADIAALLPGLSLPVAEAVDVDSRGNPQERYSYEKGDDARSFMDFKRAVRQEYVVNSNRAALDAAKFNEQAIMIYGDHHGSPLIPSIRNDHGVLLLESKDMNRCLEKHRRFDDNKCLSIDPIDDNAAVRYFGPLYKAAQSLMAALDPAAAERLERKAHESHGSVPGYINDVLMHMDANFDRIVSTKDAAARKKLLKAHDEVKAALEDSNRQVASSMAMRDAGMAERAIKTIVDLRAGQSVTIVLGDLHVLTMFDALGQAYPELPIVCCAFAGNLDSGSRSQRHQELERHAQALPSASSPTALERTEL